MSDPVLALLLLFTAAAVTALAHSFRSLDFSLLRQSRIPVIVGVVAGVGILWAGGSAPLRHAVVTGVLLTLAALYVRLTGSESDPADGLAIGAMTGLAAAVPLLVSGRGELIALASSFLAGAASGYGITFALTHVTNRVRQALLDAATAAVAAGVAYLPAFAARLRTSEQLVAFIALALVPVTITATVFQRWSVVRAELLDEASLGVIDHGDVRPTAHPLRRLGRAGWRDAVAHREFVRLATQLAVRKRQQRSRPEQIARIYQLEVLKLRMQLREAERVEFAMRAQAEAERSDTMADRKA